MFLYQQSRPGNWSSKIHLLDISRYVHEGQARSKEPYLFVKMILWSLMESWRCNDWTGLSSSNLTVTRDSKWFSYLGEIRVIHARTELIVCSWLLVCYQHIFTLSCSREAEDQLTGTRCGYLAVTPAGTVTGYTPGRPYLYRHCHCTPDTPHTRLVTVPIIKQLQTSTLRQLPRTLPVCLPTTFLNCEGMCGSGEPGLAASSH